MAYAFTVAEPVTTTYLDQRVKKYVVTETGITGATDEYTLSVPEIGRVVGITAVGTFTAGTATSIDPRLGETSGGVEVWENGTAAASVRDRTVRPYVATANALYGRSGANGTITTGGVVTTVYIAVGP